MTMAVMQPLMSNNMWSTNLCDCCDDMSICCCGLWCYPCLVGSTLSDVNENSCLGCCGCGCPSPVHLALRYGVRKQYGIEGSLCSDWCKVACCSVCSMCQVAREIKRRKAQQATTTVINVQPVHMPMASVGDALAAGLSQDSSIHQ
ncbi:placenta-specific gene 8 protein-like [Engraulis encrasicolus]|uniref:placenta-specific gene 8 protein-like n=1 Tax=Engraulis encrasicolus TaxID=184585 RepID=UPI002FD07629